MDPEAELYDLKVDSIVRPVGVDNRSPRFSWKMQSDKTGWRQSAYQLTVKDGDKVVWDSGRVESADSTAIAYEGQALRSSAEYDWTARVWDADGVQKSAASTFETGLFADDLAGVSWISAGDTASEATEYTIDFDFIVDTDNQGFCFGMRGTGTFVMWQINTFDDGARTLLRPHFKENGVWTAYPGGPGNWRRWISRPMSVRLRRYAESRSMSASLYPIGGRRCARIPQVVYPL